MSRKRISLGVCICAMLIITAQAAMSIAGSSLCHTQGCEIVTSAVSSDMFYVGGAMFFALLSILVFTDKSFWATKIVIAGLVGESVFVLYQAIILDAFCQFCVVVLLFVFLAASTIINSGKEWLSAGIYVFATATAFMLVSPGLIQGSPKATIEKGITSVIPSAISDSRQEMYLFYSDTCSHCEDVVAKVKNMAARGRIGAVNLNNARDVCNKRVLSALGINHVPALCAKDERGSDMKIVVGSAQIEEFLSATSMSSSSYTEKPGYPLSKTHGCLLQAETPCINY